MSPTIRDVARAAGVSVATASRVMSGSSYPVAPEVRHRVVHAARQLGYTPNAFARGLSKRESRFIGLIVPNISEPFFLEIARGAEALASRAGYLVVLCNTDREPAMERKYLEELRSMRAGAILTGRTSYEPDLVRDLATHPAPIVTIGNGLPCACVWLDNVGGARTATSHLADLGHRRIAFIGGSPTSLSAADRLTGFRLAMAERGLELDERLIVQGGYSVEGGASAMEAILSAGEPPDAVFAANDQMAIGAVHAALKHGLRIPRDLSVVGFNDIPISAYLNPPLTTIHLPIRRVGEVAAELLLRQLKGDPVEGTVSIGAELVVRESTAPRGASRG